MAKNSEEKVEQGLIRRENSPAPVATMADIEQLGKMFETSGMFGCNQQGQGTVLAMTCVMQRMTPLEFIQTYHIVEGRPSMRSDAMLAKLLEIGGSYKIMERTPEVASVWMKYRSAEGTFTLTHAHVKEEPFYWKKDGKTPKDNYASPRKRMQMLWARVTSDGVRAIAPIVSSGLYTPEEVADFGDDKPTAKQAKSVTVSPPMQETTTTATTATVEVLPPVDYGVMPIGKNKGKRFDELDAVMLEKIIILEGYEAITPEHKAEAKKALDAKKEQAQ